MEWRPAGWWVCLPLLIFPCTIQSRSSLLAPAHLVGPGKRAIRWLWCGVVFPEEHLWRWVAQVFLWRPDGLPVTQPTGSRHWVHLMLSVIISKFTCLLTTVCFCRLLIRRPFLEQWAAVVCRTRGDFVSEFAAVHAHTPWLVDDSCQRDSRLRWRYHSPATWSQCIVCGSAFIKVIQLLLHSLLLYCWRLWKW